MKVHEILFIDYGLLQVFGYLFKSPFYYDNSKNIQKNHTMWLYIYIYIYIYIYHCSGESFINLNIYI